MRRVVFDTNVYFSAYGFGGRPAKLMKAAIAGEFELVTSPALLAELARVLADKLEFDDTHVEEVIRQVSRVAHIARPLSRISVIADDPDNRVLECAVEGGADTIVSGDRHLLALGEFAGIAILSVTDASGALGPRASSSAAPTPAPSSGTR